MNRLVLSHEEMRAFWLYSQEVLVASMPEDRYNVMRSLVENTFPPERKPEEIANRYYALMVCLDYSEADLNRDGLGVFGGSGFMVTKDVMIKLWDYFGDLSRTVSPGDIVRAYEILWNHRA